MTFEAQISISPAADMGRSLLFPVLAPVKLAARSTGGRLMRSPFCRSFAQASLCSGSVGRSPHAGNFLPELLSRKWMLQDTSVTINQISFEPGHPGDVSYIPSFSNNLYPRRLSDGKSKGSSFYIIRDDLLHPVLNGNKARKLDAVMPILQESRATHVVTCGGCQSAHTAAVAIACAERGIRSHLLLRGEQPEIPTGYNLMSMMFGDISYIPRTQYADREEMLRRHATVVAGSDGSVLQLDDLLEKSLDYCDPDSRFLKANKAAYAFYKEGAEKDSRKVVIINEGAGNVVGLLGVIRLVKCLSEHYIFGKEEKTTIIVDAGTGTTAVGLALGTLCLGLPWKIVAVMLAETIDGYKRKENILIKDFNRIFCPEHTESSFNAVHDGIVCWNDRVRPRRFGRVEKGEIQMCRQIARQTGILVDPIYTLAAWEQAMCLSQAEEESGSNVIMLHTGGTLNMFGLAQRYTSQFNGSSSSSYHLRLRLGSTYTDKMGRVSKKNSFN